MVRMIGLSNGNKVIYDVNIKMVFVEGTEVKMYGVRNLADAIERCKRNLKNFKEM